MQEAEVMTKPARAARGGGLAGWLAALPATALLIAFASQMAAVARGEVIIIAVPWVPSLGAALSFRIDGLSLLFALLICGIGALILIYADAYLAGHAQRWRLLLLLLLFMGAMLGLVLADNLLLLFIFWELTSLVSYLLIGATHTDARARAAALQALLVTGGGGLALLAGVLLLGAAGGSMELTTLLTSGDALRGHALYWPIALLMLLAAFTKSAQLPFHFWLPNAMAAPTPISAYLHSATMVKAGVYLLARLTPVLGGTPAWATTVTAVGAATMLLGALLALRQTDLKRLLAYSTISALGTLTMLLGLDTPTAAKAALLFLLAHALYKSALFLVAGVVDHAVHTRDVTRLSGLGRAMPITAVAACLAALGMAGVPPLGGFLAKEYTYEAALAGSGAALLTGLAVIANAALVAVAALVGLRPFLGRPAPDAAPPRAPGMALWLGPLLLAGLGLAAGLAPAPVAGWLVGPAVWATTGTTAPVSLALWHGWTPMLALSALTLVAGAAAYAAWSRPWAAALRSQPRAGWGPERLYEAGLAGLQALARGQTRLIQSGYLRVYVLLIVLTTLALAGAALALAGGPAAPPPWPTLPPHEWVVVGLILGGALATVMANSRLAAIVALGVVGYAMALLFLLYGGPDLAMTQVAIETLTVSLFLLVIYRLPRFAALSSRAARLRDALVALLAGGLVTALMLAVTAVPLQPRLTPYFADVSLPLAFGRNVVNVILVDFRALDTLGEITVLAVAAIGVYALLRLRPHAGDTGGADREPHRRAGGDA